MRTTTCCMLVGCLVLIGGSCLAAESAADKEQTVRNDQIAEVSVPKGGEELRGWVNSIKPAAGHVAPAHKATNYWERTVRRDTQKHLQE